MLTYWQRHPSLSYLFAGRFVGTTSQAPRVDEGRAEALYELEIAFAEIARLAGRRKAAKPWVTDRALRHLLTDITGNTHRAEFCIDKLYSPDSARGRLGLLELRGFEMPPHFQMAMVQSLLVRSLVAWFWDEPLRAPLIRHGANLHGRYLLPHFMIHDIADVAADLRAHDINFDTSWLDPFTEFRFPRIGTAVFDGVEIELRGAIEPWNMLGEESTAAGTARYVDSSVERIQVRTIGADRQRYVVTVNGYPMPLLATDNPDVQVGGVRFRAWQPPSALHPTITVDGPLRFELVDMATGTSRGGCTYHVSHPGGRSYDSPPVNAVEAESRRGRRFEATGFTPGNVDISDIREKQARQSTDVGAPGILDLRRVRTVLQTEGAHSARRSAISPHEHQTGGGPLSLSAAGLPVAPTRPLRPVRSTQALFDPRGGGRSPGTTSSSTPQAMSGRRGVELADCVGERGRDGLERLRSVVRSLVDNDGITYVQVDTQRRSGHQRRRQRGARCLASRRHPAAAVGGRLGHTGSRSGAALPAAGRGAGRPVRSSPLGDRRRCCRRNCCSPIPATSGPPAGSRSRAASAVHARRVTSAARPTARSWSTRTGRRHPRGPATHWPTGGSSPTPSPTSTSGSGRARPHRWRRHCGWR